MKRTTFVILFIILIAICDNYYVLNKFNTIVKTNDSLMIKCINLDNRLQTVEQEWERINNIADKISILSPKIKNDSKLKLAYYIYYYGKQYDNSELLENIMISLPRVESTYKKYALGKAGEVGYYQIHPIHISDSELKNKDIYDEGYQVKKAYQILNQKFNIYFSMEYAINSYNGWASKSNPYYDKVIVQLERIKNI